MSWKSLLHDNGHTLEDVEEQFKEKTRWLNEDKEYVTVTDQLTKEEKKIPHGRAATRIQEDFPIKMFVMEELMHDGGVQLRLGYYVVSTDRLKDTGDLLLSWGQYSPHAPPNDLEALFDDARDRGIL